MLPRLGMTSASNVNFVKAEIDETKKFLEKKTNMASRLMSALLRHHLALPLHSSPIFLEPFFHLFVKALSTKDINLVQAKLH